MRKSLLFTLAALLFGLVACSEKDEPVVIPSIVLEKVSSDVNSLNFNVTLKDAQQAAYVVLEENLPLPSLAEILSDGVLLDTRKAEATIVVNDLTPETSYQVIAAASNGKQQVASNTLYMATTALPELTLDVTLGKVTHEEMTFQVQAQNAEKVAYLVVYASNEVPEANYVLVNGNEVALNNGKAEVRVKGLECAKEYMLRVVAQGHTQVVAADPVYFETEDDPSNVIRHDYTVAHGFSWGSNYFIQLSYGEYDDDMLCLDFYAQEQNYLPAGVYEVRESTEAPVLSTYYSTLGYEDGVKFRSGQVEVIIDQEAKTYTFDVDIILIDGRHLVASYAGEVDGMPIEEEIPTEYVTFTAAAAEKVNDDGSRWMLSLSDANGNEATFDLNTASLNYIQGTSYTIGTTELGEFNAANSSFTLAANPGEDCAFATGTLHVSLDWMTQEYSMSLYATLENGTPVEATFQGVVEGSELNKSEDVITVDLYHASASSYSSGSNWYINLSDEKENYRLTLDVYCKAAKFLPEGEYTLGSTVSGQLNQEISQINIVGEGSYIFEAATLLVEIDYEAKTYRMDLIAEIEDGRTFECIYEGEVAGMTVEEVDNGEVLEVVWTSASIRHWYSNNFQLVLQDENSEYTADLDMYSSSTDYLAGGTYVLDGSSDEFTIRDTYSYFRIKAEGNEDLKYSAAEAVVALDAENNIVQVDFTATLTDGRQFKGTYTK